MKKELLLLFGACVLQASAQTAPKEDFAPSATNQNGQMYPMVNSEGCVRAQLKAPDAKQVLLDIGGVKYEMRKDAEGVWTGESAPQQEGFHYYQLNVDGVNIPDPGTKIYYGAGRLGSGVEVPAYDRDFYALKDVPHGLLSELNYHSDITKGWRRCFVYTPPQYDTNPEMRFPVLYLQHGSFEDETGWGTQGKANIILDNLIAEGKAEPMIIVIDNGYAMRPDATNPFAAMAFEDVLIQEVIPMIDKRFRTKTDAENRAIAGLSMGANQTMHIAMNHPDMFDYYGGFSGTANYPSAETLDAATFLNGKFSDAKKVNDSFKVYFLGLGTAEPEPFPGSVGAFKDMLDRQGINYVYYESPETAHEWQTWRRDLYQFAQLLFK